MRCRAFTVVGLALLAAAALATQLMAGEETLAQRGKRLEQMSDAEKTRLLQKKQRFDELSREDQDRYRKLHQELVNDPQYDRLRGTLQRYSDWLKTLTPVERAELSKLPADERLARVKQLMNAQATERFRLMVSEVIKSKDLLSRKDLNAIHVWTDEFLTNHADEILATVPDNRHTLEMKANFDRDKHIDLLRFCYFRPDSQPFRKPSPKSNLPVGAPPPGKRLAAKDEPGPQGGTNPKVEMTVEDRFERLPKPSPADEARLEERVSQQARGALEKATSSGERSRIIRNWMRAAALSRIMPSVSSGELDRFVREWLIGEDGRKDRERLESLPRDRMYHELRKLYFRKRFERGRRAMRSRSGPRREGGPGGPPGRIGNSRQDGGRGPRGAHDGKQDQEPGRGRGKSRPDQEKNGPGHRGGSRGS